jgi:acetyltransferase-like isoleucine patch superfamily enzyme
LQLVYYVGILDGADEVCGVRIPDCPGCHGLFSDLIGKKVDDSFLLIPPFYTTSGVDISIGRNVFVNQNCTFYDLGGL